jgi:Tol biopolymer transport system component
MSARTRWGLFIGLAVIVIVIVGLLFATDQIRNAPLPTSDTAQTVVTAAPETGDIIPLGVPGRDLAVMTNREGNWDVALISADGSVKLLTGDNTTTQEYFPSWAMDGKQLNFVSTRLDPNDLGPTQINADGTGLENLTVVSAIFSLAQSGRFDWDPAWSPNGKQMIWSSLRDLNLELYLIDTAKDFKIENAKRMTNGGARDWFATWSPDGKTIVRASDASGTENIYVMTLATGQEVLLTSGDFDETRPAFSLDGQSVIYVSDEGETLVKGELNFLTVPITGGESKAPGTTVFAGAPVWTPDSTQVAYMSNESGTWQIYVMDQDGANKRRITPDDGDYVYPVWRP